MTSQLQPLDVSINKPLKHLVQKHYEAWLNKDNHILMTRNKIKRASASIIVKWISKADILWDDSEQSGEDSSSSENGNATEGSLDEISD
jgi:hypothetical protein